jgi:acyl-coenzyme A thioesterase PaaI-like protein
LKFGGGGLEATPTRMEWLRSPDVTAMSVEELQAFLLSSFDPPPSFVVERITDEGIRLRLPKSGLLDRPGGTVSGPSLMALADSTAWLAILGQIGPVALAVTTSLHIDFLRKPAMVDVLAEGHILKLGRRLGVVDVALYSDLTPSEDRPLVAKAQVTYSIPPAESRTEGPRS